MKSEKQLRTAILGMLELAEFSYKQLHDEYYKGQMDAYETMLRFLMEEDAHED